MRTADPPRNVLDNVRPMAHDWLTALGISKHTAAHYADKAQSAAHVVGAPFGLASEVGGALHDADYKRAANSALLAAGLGVAGRVGRGLLPIALTPAKTAGRDPGLLDITIDPIGSQYQETMLQALRRAGYKSVDDVKLTPRAYHGTDAQFDRFRDDLQMGPHFGTRSQARDILLGRNADGARVIPVDLDIKNPKLTPDFGDWTPLAIGHWLARFGNMSEAKFAKSHADIRDMLHARGHDGIVYPNAYETPGLSYIATRPNTVRSATDPDKVWYGAGGVAAGGAATQSGDANGR